MSLSTPVIYPKVPFSIVRSTYINRLSDLGSERGTHPLTLTISANTSKDFGTLIGVFSTLTCKIRTF